MTAIADTGVTQIDATFYKALLDAGVADADARELARTDAFGGSNPELWIDLVRDGQLPQPPAGEISPELAAAIDNARDKLFLDTSPLTTACEFIARGWSPLPIPRQKKAPTIKGWQHLRVDAATVTQYFNGHAQNVGVLLGAPSGGLVDIDLDTREAVQLAPAFLPPTDAVFGRAGKRRSHWLYRVDPLLETIKYGDVEEGASGGRKVNMLVELRSTGAQTVFPGSAHEDTGEIITWERSGDPALVDGAQLVADVGRLASAAILARHWTAQGTRQDAAMAIAGVLLRGGWLEDAAVAFIRAIAQVAGDEESEKRAEAVEYTAERLHKDRATTGWKRLAELVGDRVTDRVKDWLQLREGDPVLGEASPAIGIGTPAPALELAPAPAPQDPDAKTLHLTDWGNAQRLVAQHGRDLKYCYDWGKWLIWDNKRWAVDNTGAAMRRAKATVRSIFTEISRAEDDKQQKAIKQWAFESERAWRLEAMLKLAQSEPGIAITPDQLDRDIWLLNCENGVLDLRTGELREHDRGQLITKLAPVKYLADAACPTWERFLETILPDEDVRDFVQRAAGYSLTGSVAERVLLVLWGGGRNGKSTLLSTLISTLGDYAMMTPKETFVARRDDTIPNDVARLKGARMVAASESEEEHHLAEGLVKQMTGNEPISARFMRGEWFDFMPQFTPWFGTNHRPNIRGTDKAVWDRIRLIPFTVRIPDEDVDQDLPTKLRAELPGILAWAVRGCLLWQTVDLSLGNTPPAVRQATDEYRSDMDLLAGFLDECCTLGETELARSNEIYVAYSDWSKANNEKPRSARWLAQQLGERGFDRGRDKQSRFWIGISVSAAPKPNP